MKYLVVGPTLVNDIVFADNSKMNRVLGGSVYCLAGIKLWCDSCLYVSKVGNDFSTYYGQWMKANGMSLAGLSCVLLHTFYTTLTYRDKGLHSEESIYSDDIETQENMNEVLRIEDICAVCSPDTKGIYIEASENVPVWDSLNEIRKIADAKIMWELPTSAALDTSRKADVRRAMEKTDIYSVNIPEACSLFGAEDEEAAVKAVKAFGKPCFLRAGKRGSYFIEDGEAYFAPSVTVGEIVDATGCGNASTAAALYAWCEGYPKEEIPKIANISAAFNLLQYGPFPEVTAAVRSKAIRLLQSM